MKEVINQIKQSIIESGRVVIHSAKPDEFEYYACTFELLNSQLETEEIFHFPIMPTAMAINSQYPVNIKKSGRGYLSQISDTYVGKNISLNGSFGRRFRILLHTSTTEGAPGESGTTTTDLKIRTGYGATKLMEQIMTKNLQPDSYGSPRLLVLHNYAYNLNVVVEVLSFSLSQSMENNMMWNFGIEMKALADYDLITSSNKDKSFLSKLLKQTLAQRAINNLIEDITPGNLTKAIGF